MLFYVSKDEMCICPLHLSDLNIINLKIQNIKINNYLRINTVKKEQNLM